jgi:hypothetical protein
MLFTAGILRHSFIPEGKYMELRMLVRERLDIIGMGSAYVNKMQKCLELMNIKLKEVISWNQRHKDDQIDTGRQSRCCRFAYPLR